ncbi:HPr family phosphocarrier protein [Butyrivibrio sp.]|uniref:HPr family phosphocarrier protein n=1 Tax=Butyrivibrio sp. TaxID=28121 RepID=UPI0025C38F5B|nr:HPr family phosphocarrier protein [Butyrivibrio sp.]MBQ9304122.1 HPr family phosphocarrier protein [Butyrivibrio sp.]
MKILSVKICFDSVEAIKDFVNIATQFAADFLVSDGHHTVNGQSILGMFSLDYTKQLTLKITIPADSDLDMNDILYEIRDYRCK